MRDVASAKLFLAPWTSRTMNPIKNPDFKEGSSPMSPPSHVPISPEAPASSVLTPERWLDDHGDYLFHYALSRVRNPGTAEDLVQEALLAGMRSRDRYEGRSAERTWLVGILRNKILDHLRKAGRETPFTDLDFYQEEEAHSFDQADRLEHWASEAAPHMWHEMGASLDRTEFWRVFHLCTSKLPDRVARVFLMREVDDLDSEEICATLNISSANLWVMLHRARMALRRCLETNWFHSDNS